MSVKKLGILCPQRGQVDGNFLRSYLNLFLFFMKQPNIVPVPIFSEGVPLDKARNELVKEALLSHCDYVLWLDSDIIASEQSLKYMWDSFKTDNYDIMSGIYYERSPPFNPVLRREAEFNKMLPIYAYPQNELFLVDGFGFGFVMMKLKVLIDMVNKYKKPFLFSSEVSEDLYFCRRAREIGYKLYVNPLVQLSHVGAGVSQWHFLHYKFDEYADIKELAEYRNEKPDKTLDKCISAPIEVYKEWKRTFGDKKEEELDDSEIIKFYENVDYLYDLTFHWSKNRATRDSIFSSINPTEQKIYLDFGCGIGDYGITILEEFRDSFVVFYDINKKNLEYIKYRIKKRNLEDRCLIVSKKSDINIDKFDVVFAMDVFEHIKKPEVELEYIKQHLNKNGVVYSLVAKKEPFQPFHISSKFCLENNGFIKLNDFIYILKISDKASDFNKLKSISEKGGSDD